MCRWKFLFVFVALAGMCSSAAPFRTSLTAGEPTTNAGEKAGAEREDNGLNMKLCWCPAGTFKMGSPATDKHAMEDEKPQVDVTLTNGFWLGKHEITQGQFQSVMRTTPWKGKTFVKEGTDYAASYVSWVEAVEFCKKLSASERKEGRLSFSEAYRLPTEAEWEHACRAGSTTRYSFGDDDAKLNEHAWYGTNASEFEEKYAHQVGLKKANAWGLHDMHGNVWEWCNDLYGEKLPGGLDPTGPSTGTYWVARGGGWDHHTTYCRSASRDDFSYDPRYSYLGFRISLSPSVK